MTSKTDEPVRKRRMRDPKITVDSAHQARIEGLAERAMQRNPEMAERLLDEVGRARIVASAKMPKNVISIGSAVTYRDESTGQDKSVILVYPEDADIAQQRISLLTPIGVALLGLSEGDTFHWDTRDKQRRTLTVTSVGPAPDIGFATGDGAD